MQRDDSDIGQNPLPGWFAFASLILLSTLAISSCTCNGTPATDPGPDGESNGDSVAEGQHPPESVPKTGRELYLHHCAACHGDNGDGKGLAARFIFPKPRDFRAGKFRLVSTKNNVPSAENLDAVLVRGMPGSSMPPWNHLSADQRKLLVEEVMRLRREGASEQYVAVLKNEEGLTDDEIADPDVQDEIKEFADSRSTPGETSEVPTIGEPSAEAIARGKEIYIKQSCHSCHGEDGKGGGTKEQIDDEGYPTRPRDYTRGIFKGGHDPASLYRRIAYGMPGTPMPSSTNLTSEQTTDLVHFLRSMSDEKTREAAVLKRKQLIVRQVGETPASPGSEAWSDVEPLGLQMVPLWWRDDGDPGLQVQAVHDGKTIAFRLSWQDDTADRHAAKSEAFEDGVALELYRGDAEPFFGMGAKGAPIDMWFWDADRQGDQVAMNDLYPNAPVNAYTYSATGEVADEVSHDGAGAAGNPIVPTDTASGGSSLTAGGPGTLTFRLPKNQSVQAHGEWGDGRWSVVMTRELVVDAESDGLSLDPGSENSIAFAVWDGSQRDRDGKKLITIWHNLKLEQ